MANGALPIPGTKRVANLEGNVKAAKIELTAEDSARLEEISPESAVYGTRYKENKWSFAERRNFLCSSVFLVL